MSQMVTRKSNTTDDKEKTENPVKEMKKKIAANAEKEKQAAVDKPDKPEKNDKEAADKKQADKTKDDKSVKSDKQVQDKADKIEKSEKNDATEKSDKKVEKIEKKIEKTDKKVEKPEKSDKKLDKSLEKKPEADKKDESKVDKAKEKQSKPVNGTHNGAQAANGEEANGTVSDGSEDELVIEEDEVFPELTYEDSDTDAFESEAPSRSLTRRSQVKVTKTPETPRPHSEKESDDSKESKILKLRDEPVAPSDRKLRSSDSPKPESKKEKKDSPKKHEGHEEEKTTNKEIETDTQSVQNDGKGDKDDDVIFVEPEIVEGVTTRTRARVSPYSRPDRSLCSGMADYTGNNSTMEMDITESSVVEEGSNSSFLRGLRDIRGRGSYKLLRELKLTNPNANRPRPPPQLPLQPARPTGAVVGRKRKPSESAPEEEGEGGGRGGKRVRLLDRLALPFRRHAHRTVAAEIVGINSDLPLTAPVASTSTFDPETIKPPPLPAALPAPPLHAPGGDNKRCSIM